MNFDEAAMQAVREGRLLIDRYDAWLFRKIEPYLGRRVLEIGCGLGNMSRRLLASRRDLIVAIDTSAESVAAVRQQFAAHPNLRAVVYSITAPEVLALQSDNFDSAVSLNVFEHIEDDVLALRQTRQLLQPEGRLVLIVPAHEWLYGTMDRSIGHYRRYTKESLRGKLEETGFRVVRQAYVNLLGAMGWWLHGRVLRHKTPPAGQLRLFNALVPYWTALEDRAAPPFGISVLSIAERTSP
jgi:SAM-dependent methyltransferase